MVRTTIPSKDGFVCAGVILGAHGIKGEVKFKLTLEDETILKKYGVPVNVDGAPFSISGWRQGPKGPLLKFENITDRDAAEALRGTALYIPRDALPDLSDEVYYTDLVGLKVLSHEGNELGKVAEVFSNGAQEVLTIYGNGKEVLLPYTDDVVETIDLDGQTLSLTEFAYEFFTL